MDEVAALKPTFVVAGHKKIENGNDPKIIGESQQYLRDFSRFAKDATTPDDIATGMLEIYPDWDNLRTLWCSARAAITRKDSWLCGGHCVLIDQLGNTPSELVLSRLERIDSMI